jgi:hypothetical protein
MCVSTRNNSMQYVCFISETSNAPENDLVEYIFRLHILRNNLSVQRYNHVHRHNHTTICVLVLLYVCPHTLNQMLRQGNRCGQLSYNGNSRTI